MRSLIENPAASQWSFTFGVDDDVIVFSDDDATEDGISRLRNETTGFVFDLATPTSLSIVTGGGADSVVVNDADGEVPNVTLVGATATTRSAVEQRTTGLTAKAAATFSLAGQATTS